MRQLLGFLLIYSLALCVYVVAAVAVAWPLGWVGHLVWNVLLAGWRAG